MQTGETHVMDTAMARSERSTLQRGRLVLRKYVAILQVSVANNLAYIMEVLFRALFMVVIVFILSQLWKTTFSSRGATTISGFSINTMIWYLICAETIALSLPMLTKRIDQEVRSGQLAYLLGRPCSYIGYNFAQYLGERLVRLALNALVGITLGLLVAGVPDWNWIGLLACPVAIFLAVCIDFVIYFSIGLLAFWTEETQPFVFIFSRLTLVLGGVLAPLEIFPPLLRSIALVLPFSAILYGPARTLVHFEPDRFAWLLVQQIATLMVGGIIMLFMYSIAIRRVNINGG
jgi:ABC-2 type transport system permease protein